jgi:glycosyltransferase involved in cell wall biosynthesis
MNLIFLQRLDQAGGGSRASLRTTLRALREQRPDWQLTLATQNAGPLSGTVTGWGVAHAAMAMPHFRNHFQRPAFWLACRRMAAWVKTIQADGVVSNEWVTAPHALSVGRKLGIPAMSYVRDFAAIQRGRKYQLHKMDRLLCVCDSMRQALVEAGYDSQKVRTVYNPVLRPVNSKPDSSVHERILRQTEVDHWLLYLGRISLRKNQIAAVETLRHLRHLSGKRWGLLLAGDADDAYAAEVHRAVVDAGLEGAVLQLGMVTEPGWLFELAEASIMTSKSEGLARVLIESFLCGTPGFSFPLEGLEDIYGDALPRFVPGGRKPEDLAEIITAALADAVALRERVESMRLMLEARHSAASHVAAFEEAIRLS